MNDAAPGASPGQPRKSKRGANKSALTTRNDRTCENPDDYKPITLGPVYHKRKKLEPRLIVWLVGEGWNRQGKRDQHTVGIRQGLHLEKIKPSVVEAKNIMGLHRQLGPQKAHKPSDGMEQRT